MEKRIELERRARRANQITELNLDNCRSTSIVGLTDEYTALESLSLINVGLTTLKGFPKLPNLKRLELSDNRISNGLNYLATSPKLAYLNLSGNKIKDLETLKPLEAFENLAVLDLFNNQATQTENYREKVFEMLPSLEFLDGFDASDVEASSDGDDDDEVNGNDSEDEGKNAFCINGLEIDLDELEQFEKRVKEKKSIVPPSSSSEKNITPSNQGDDDLDEYLKQLKLKESSEADNGTITNNTNQIATLDSFRTPTSYPLLLYWFMALLNLVSAAAYFSDDMGEDEDDGDEDEEDESDDEDNGDVSLAEVYNDDLEEDNSEWDEEDGGGGDDDDDESDDEEANGEATATAAAATAAAADPAAEQKDTETAEEQQARGKKRKHDG